MNRQERKCVARIGIGFFAAERAAERKIETATRLLRLGKCDQVSDLVSNRQSTHCAENAAR